MELHFPILLDGATGTELQKRGYRGGISAEQWVLEHPDAITDLHNNYIEAGSDVLYAPYFWGQPGQAGGVRRLQSGAGVQSTSGKNSIG